MTVRATTTFRKLFQPGRIGPLELRNRFIMTAMGNNLVEDSTVTDRQIAYYEERALGGVAMIIAGACQLNQGAAKWNDLTMGIGEDRFLPKLRELTATIRRHGAVAGVQLLHAGGYCLAEGVQAVSASVFTSGHSRRTTRELSVPEIRDIVEEFGVAAARAREVGFQLVELNCCSGYLVREFLSPRTNKRTDQYGGPLENRLRFLLEVVAEIGETAGPDLPIVCRLTGDEFLEGGHRLDEAIAIAKAVEAAGVAAIDVTVGGHETGIPLTPGMVPPAVYAYYAQQIRRAVHVPVIYATKVNSPQRAEELLRDGKADFVGMVRALNADPFLPRKAAEGRVEEIIPCVACHQGCYDQLFSDKPIFCLANPRTAYERERRVEPAERVKRVLVIGGGGGGMESALVAARRGHRVTLVEQSDRLGGQLEALSAPPGKHDFRALLAYLTSEVHRRGVDVILGREATESMVAHMHPDAVIVATGSQPAGLPIPGADLPNVFSAHQVLAGDVDLGDRVVVVGGNAVGVETALYAAQRGALSPEEAVYLAAIGAWDPQTAIERTKRAREVTILEMLPRAGSDLGRTTRWSTMMAVRNAGISLIAEAKAIAFEPDAVLFEKAGQVQRIPADTIVTAVGARPNDGLAEELKGRVAELHVIGDATQPRKLVDAMREGFLVASSL